MEETLQMLNSNLAMIVLTVLAIVLAIIIPLLDAIPKLSSFVSLRWSCIAVILLLMVGVVVDFSHLSDETRNLILKGGLVIVGGYLALRTLEKILYNGWLKGVNLKGSVEKNGWKIGMDVSSEPDKNKQANTEKKKDIEKKVEQKENKKEEEIKND